MTIEIPIHCPTLLKWMQWQEVIELDRDAVILETEVLEVAA